MIIYKLPIVNSLLGEYDAFLYADDDIYNTTGLDVVEQDLSSPSEVIAFFDNNLNSGLWQFANNAIFNANPSTGGLLNAIELLTHIIKMAHPLGPYDTTTSITTTNQLVNGNTYNELFQFGLTGESASARRFTVPLASDVILHGNYGKLGDGFEVNFYVVPSDSVVNKKLNLTGKYARNVTLYCYYNGSKYYARVVIASSLSTITTNFRNSSINSDVTPAAFDEDDDPYSGDDGEEDPSGGGGGPGGDNQDNWDDDSDPNPVPPLPSLSAVDTGFITLYNPSISQLKNLANYLWSGLFDIETYRKIMADPMDTILGLSIVPVDVPSLGDSVVTVGNISTGISMTKASSQYVEVNCGTVVFDEKWHSYLDYNPYCKLSIMLPYIGSQELDIDQIQGTTLGVVYHIDVLSGACVAYITVDGSVVAEFSGQCAISIPITENDFTNTITSLCTLVASGIGVVASGGLSAPITAASIGGLATAAANTAANVISSKPTFAKSGNISGSNGLMSIQKPYVILERPKLCAPARQNTFTGYPAYITRTLSELSGFTQVQDIHLNGVNCTDAEHDEILSLLRSGVIL